MKAIVLVVGVVASSVQVVQGQYSDPCEDFNKNKCGKKDECTWLSAFKFCLLTAGTGSVVRDGSENTASGEYCAVGGGQRNDAGFIGDAYNVIGGGDSNGCFGNKNIISGGNFNTIDYAEFDTISGGWNNEIFDSPSSVITGGGGVFGTENYIYGCDTSTVSGGKKNRIRGLLGSIGNTISGGLKNTIEYSEMQYRTITGGHDNDAEGLSAVVSGGERNRAYNRNSLAFGQNAASIHDNSMVVNLIGGLDEDDLLTSDEDGQFLVSAESFRFQIGNDSTELTKTNIQNLRTALEEEE